MDMVGRRRGMLLWVGEKQAGERTFFIKKLFLPSQM